ncbi:MAG TPA: serine hydrolase domain-containing protein [Gemmatimonadales bacterium]|nr:serine hydrolase domain-containing protein [Gemmatimonadales bacterium]
MFLFRIATTGLLLGAVVAPAPAPAQAAPPRLPDTPMGRIVSRYLTLFNAGDAAAMRAFFTENVSTGALQRRSADERAAIYLDMLGANGGFELSQVLDVAAASITVLLHTRKDEWRRIEFRFDPDPPNKLLGLGVEDADPPAALPAAPSGPLSESLAVSELTGYLDARARTDEFSGTVLVARNGRPILQRTYGLARVEQKIPNRADTRFNLGSDSKLFTQVAIGQLIEQGKLKFDTRIGEVLPDYLNAEAAKKVTVRQLLTMTSGIGDFFGPRFDAAPPHRIRTTGDYLTLFADQPLEFEPGGRQQYSNGGYIVLGAIIEKISGRSYYDYVREHIFRPAGMNETDSYEIDAAVPNLATGYTTDDGRGPGPRRSNRETLPGRGSSAGGGYSTAPDLLRFAMAVHQNRLLTPAYTTWFVTRVEPSAAATSDSVRARSFGWLGGSPGVNASITSNATTGYTVIVLSNYDPPSATSVARHISEVLSRVTR